MRVAVMRVNRVLREFIARRSAGAVILDEQVLADHADLASELSERLEALHAVERLSFRHAWDPVALPTSQPVMVQNQHSARLRREARGL
jgi:hypothetical protein